ncbi:MAG: hypothetical protein U9R01_05970 [candidate division WOR-3 bacterium]|nr:hypothetical protein [candidate division WOR-3 bacterium]
MESIEIVCLANSRKISGRCIVGKVILENKWMRPVSNRDSEEISEEERRYENGQMPKLLDIISIPVKEHKPQLFQNENYLINDDYYWEKRGEFSSSLDNLLDAPNDLWGTQSSSYQGQYDRIPEDMCVNYEESLYLIKPQSLKIIVRTEGQEFDNAKRKVRAKFKYNDITYIFPVTDPVIERKYLSGENGNFTLSTENIYLCVSVGLPYNGYCYKFLASIIEME